MKMSMDETPSQLVGGSSTSPPLVSITSGDLEPRNARSHLAVKCYPTANTSNINNNGYSNGVTWTNYPQQRAHRSTSSKDHWSPPPASTNITFSRVKQLSSCFQPQQQQMTERSPHRSHSDRSGRKMLKPPTPPIRTPNELAQVNGGVVVAGLYRSNSSLDLDGESVGTTAAEDRMCGLLRREYGSASSIDVMSTSGESFFAMLRNFGEDLTRNSGAMNPQDQRSPGPAHIAEYLRGKIEPLPVTQNASNTLNAASSALSSDEQTSLTSLTSTTSPKTKSKFSRRLWESSKDKNKNKNTGGGGGGGGSSNSSEPSIFRKLRGTKSNDLGSNASSLVDSSSRGSDNSLDNAESRYEDKLRRKCFAHYDVQSITANLSFATTRLRNVLGRRRNTTTGASAASMSNNRSGATNGISENSSEEFNSTEENLSGLGLGGSSNSDNGDGHSNELVLSCPYFRNELGGEGERVLGLTRMADLHRTRYGGGSSSDDAFKSGERNVFLHRPSMACGLSVLERAEDGHWKTRACPYQKHSFQRENFDQGAYYFKIYFHKQEHQNWFGIDDNLGPVAVSIRRVKIDESSSSSSSAYQYRLIIRTSELATLRGTVLEEAIPTLKHNGGRGSIRAREVLEYVAPELQLSCLRLGTAGTQTEEQLLKLDQQATTNHYKVGILYCRGGQSTEEEMYNNELAGPALEEFLELIGQRVRLKGFDKYRAQLDNKTDSTGLYSVYSTFQECEIMFHVSTLLPYTANNRQQLLRKRHIGNDIVTIIFQESDALSFTPKNIRSHFQHVFIVVRAINPCTDNTKYSVAVSRSKDVPVFGPPIPENATFSKSRAFADFLLAKVINAENAAHQSEKFSTMATRTKQEYLKDLANNHVTTTTIDTGPKFPILSFGGKKKERSRPRFIPEAIVRGAIVWHVQVDDYGQASVVDCFLGISGDTLVLVDEVNREVVFACPCSSILGWSSNTNNLRIYYHQGECVVLRTKDDDLDEIQEIVSRLCCVTQGCEVQEFTLKRNNLGQLGFHVQQDGLITEVEPYGFAWQASLRQNSRLVEICKIVVSTLTYDQMVDILKTSLTVTVAVIPPNDNGSPRKGCSLYTCSYLSIGHTGGDYENLNGAENETVAHTFQGKSSPKQQVAQAAIKGISFRLESHPSPTKSTPSSGYSRKRQANHIDPNRFRTNESTSASSQSSEEKWYDLGEANDNDVRCRPPTLNSSSSDRIIDVGSSEAKDAQPPPLPARLNTGLYGNQSSARRREPYLSSYTSRVTPVSSRSQELLSNSSAGGYSNYIHPATNYVPSRTPETDDGKVSNYMRVGNLDHLLSDRQQQHLMRPLVTALPYASPSVRGKSMVPSPPFVTGLDKHVDSPLMERCVSSRSEDELSGSSGNSLSPRGHRRRPLPLSGSNSANSSKNHSPRTVGRSLAEASLDLKSRSNGSLSRYNYSVMSNSSGGSESTFQEDLLKLINPDLIEAEEHGDPFKRPKTPPPVPVKTNSLERSMREIQNSPHRPMVSKPESPQSADVIFTTARPATVISTASSSSSPALSETKLNRDERLSPRVMINVASKSMSSIPTTVSASNSVTASPPILPLPDTTNEIDWSSLVDTATKAIEGVSMTTGSNSTRMPSWVSDTVSDIPEEPSSNSCKSSPFNPSNEFGCHRIRELEIRVRMLEEELANERHRVVTLELEVQKLRDENERLQEESQSAASQLRRFTDWFFQSIDK